MNCAYLRYKAISAERDIQDEKNKALDNNKAIPFPQGPCILSI